MIRAIATTTRRLRLAGAAALACALSAPSAAAEDSRPLWIGLSAISLVHHNNQEEINQALRSSGYSTVGTNQPIRGVAFDLGVSRWRMSWDIALWGRRSTERHSDGESFAVRQANVSLDTGVDIIQYRGFSVFPMIGLAGGDLRFEVESHKSPIIYDQIGGIDGRFELRQNTWSTRVLLGAEQRYSLSKGQSGQTMLFFGVRIGYQRQFSHSDWILDDPDRIKLHGGPSVDVSGPFLRLGAGISI